MDAITPAVDSAFFESILSAVDAQGDGVYLCDREWRIVFANRAAREMSNITPEFLNGPTLWECYPRVVGTIAETALREAMDLREPRALDTFYNEPLKAWRKIQIVPVDIGIAVYYIDLTAKIEAEHARDAAASLLDQMLEATTDAVYTLDRDWRFTYINPKARELMGAKADSLGKNIWVEFPDIVYEGSPDVALFHAAMERGESGEFVHYYPPPNDFWLYVMARPSRDGIIVFFRDITEQKRKDDALAGSEARYRVLTELNPQSLWTADPQGRVLYANQRFLNYIGKDFVPKTGEEYIACFDPEDRQRVAEVWTHSVMTGEEYSIEARLIRGSDGESRWWHLGALPLRDDSGEITQWLGVATDIHETRMAARELSQKYEEIDHKTRELEAIYSGSPIGLSLYDAKDLRLIRINKRQSEILGLMDEQAIGRTIEELIPGMTRSQEMIRRAAQGEPMLNQDVEGVLPTRPDEYRYWNVNYSPIFDEAGNVQAVAGATIEMTLQKRAESALVQSEKLAAVGRLAASISHEINNPLEAVTNLLYLIAQEDLPQETRGYVSLAQSELQRVSQIATQTLRFHRQSEKPSRVSPGQLADAVLHLYQGRLMNSNISVERRYDAAETVHCFENDIRQVMNNLIANAIDAMRSTGGRLVVRARDHSAVDGRKGVALTVADTGHGMSQGTVKRLFEPFYTTKGMNGTGLGLWISKGIVERHDGHLHVRSSSSTEAHGTVFQMFLPCERAS